jgi:hypothetical protein
MTATWVCDCAEHRANPPATVQGKHRYSVAWQESPELTGGWLHAWRWECLCGRRGRWQSQSPSCAFHAWERHAKERQR